MGNFDEEMWQRIKFAYKRGVESTKADFWIGEGGGGVLWLFQDPVFKRT